VEDVCEEQGFLTLEGVGHTVPPGTVVVNEKTGKAVAYVAYNLKEMDPTQFRAIALPMVVARSNGADSMFEKGQKLKLVDGQVLKAPRAKDVLGKVLNHLGEDYYTESSSGREGEGGVPFFNDYPGVDDRESIADNFHTGIKAVDAIVPVGRGQSMLIMGKHGTKKTTMALDMLRAHKQQEEEEEEKESRFVYCCDRKDLEEVREAIRESRLEDRSVVVVTDASSQSKGERYTGMLLSLAIADDLRDGGENAVVFLDDMSGAVHFWEEICELENSYNDEDMNELMEVDGMLIARFDALQRQFFSNILQRSAKLSSRLGGGSLTLFGLLQGEPMREDKVDLGVKVLKHQNLDPKMREKLLLAIANQVKTQADSESSDNTFFVSTRTVEEFKSISDGHILMSESNSSVHSTTEEGEEERYDIVPSLSTTRLGVGRVAAPGMMDICSSLQLMLQQNIDAQAFGNLTEESTSDQNTKSALVLKMLSQTAKRPVPTNELIIMLFAILDGYTDHVAVSRLEEVLTGAVAKVMETSSVRLPSSASPITPEDKERLRQELDKVLEKKKIKAAA
jgi:F-type H+-transporting ATPase subunit alpha